MCTGQKKTGEGGNITSLNATFGISKRRTRNMALLESWDKTRQDKRVFAENVGILKIDLIWSYIGLSLDQIKKNATIEFHVQYCQ